jgi:hypothetical protein
MMRQWMQLCEAAIDVSSVVTEADAILTQLYTEILTDAASMPIFVGKKLADASPEQRIEAAMEYHREQRKRGFSAAYRCMYDGSKALTKLVQAFMLREYGVDDDGDSVNDGVRLDGLYYPIGNIRVVIEKNDVPKGIGGHMMRKRHARDFWAVSAGVAEDERHFAGCKIYLDETVVKLWLSMVDEAVNNLVYHAFEGEYLDYEPGYYPDSLVGDVIPTFAHELDHLVYYARKPNNKRGISMIGSGGRKGRRKYVNGIGTTPEDYQRYLGSHIELQAFASDAAIEILRANVLAIGKKWMTLHDDVFNLNDPTVWNAIIDRLITKAKSGKLWSGTIAHYQKNIRDAEPDNAIYQRVWRQFLRLVIAKLERYKK